MNACVDVRGRARVSPRPLFKSAGAARPISSTFSGGWRAARRSISIPSLKLISLNEVSQRLIIMMNVLLQ